MGQNAIATFFICLRVVGTLMLDFALGRETIIAPLLFNVNQCPLPRTETIMLNAR